MESVEPCCTPECKSPAMDVVPIPLCRECLMHVAAWVAELMRQGYERVSMEAAEQRRRQRDAVLERRHHGGYVYFVRFGDRVKIGWTSDPKQRFGVLPYDEVLLVIPGTIDVEKAQHLRFAKHRIRGEWFALNDETRAMIEKLRIWHESQPA